MQLSVAKCCTIVLMMSLCHLSSCEDSQIVKIANVDEFEEKVLKTTSVALFLMTMNHEDEAKMRGVNREECQRVEGLLETISRDLSPHGIKLFIGDLDDLGPVSTEFNIRKRMLPSILLFHTRARTADVIKLEDASDVKEKVLKMLKENNNPTNEDGTFAKVTLALGG